MTEDPTQSVFVIVEGFSDRAFWKGWLLHLGCADWPESGPTTGGIFRFRTLVDRRAINVVPAHGVTKLLPKARAFVKKEHDDELLAVVVCRDSDVEEGQDHDSKAQKWATQTERLLRDIKPDLAVHPIVYPEATDGPAVPTKRTLERFVCSVMAEAYPERARAVADWLAARPDNPTDTPRAAAWSHMAGWYAESGCDDFYQAVWRDEKLVAGLRGHLEKAGLWQLVEELVGARQPGQ